MKAALKYSTQKPIQLLVDSGNAVEGSAALRQPHDVYLSNKNKFILKVCLLLPACLVYSIEYYNSTSQMLWS